MVTLTIQRPGVDAEAVAFETSAEVTIGRSSGCTLCLDSDPMVSRMHAVLLVDPPAIRIKDLNSTNGIVINGVSYGGAFGEKIVQPHELHDGDEVGIGSTVVHVGLAGESRTDSKPTRAVRYEDKGTVISSRLSAVVTDDGDNGDADLNQTLGNMPEASPQVPGFVIRGLVGKGEVASVYQARSSDNGDVVAIKVLTPNISFTKRILDDFKVEMDGVKSLRHPHLVRFYSAGALSPQNIYLVQEYVSGENLASYLTRCPKHRLPLKTAFGIAVQICSALCEAHNHGFIHRELKPENILLFDDGGKISAKVTDVGLTRSLEDSGITGLSHLSSGPRSIRYAAPEQLTEIRDVKAASDVFSLTSIFYEMLTGSSPYELPEDGEAITVETVARAPIIPVEERMPGLPESLVVIIERGLSKEPEERYQTCCDLLDALENVRIGN